VACLGLLALLAAGRSAAHFNCNVIYDGGDGWLIDACPTDPQIDVPMEVVVDGVSHGEAALIRIYHPSQAWPGTPQVAVIYASGFIRLKQNADPTPPIPFGGSFILGPAYRPDGASYRHNPQLTRLEIDTTWLPNAPLRLEASGSNEDFDVAYQMALPPPRDRSTRLHVNQTYTATSDIQIDPARHAQAEGFKLVQLSSMFINLGGPCDGGYTDCHDSDAARYIGADLARHQVAFADLTAPGPIFGVTQPLGSTWLDLLHTDDESWQGNTPNLRVALDVLPTDHTITPQGWISATSDPNQDNVGLWLHDDDPGARSWSAGESDRVSYWLLAQDDPPEPWSDLGLRSGDTWLDFEGAHNCFAVLPGSRVTGTVAPIAGYTDTALELNYDIGENVGAWAQIRCNFDPPLDLSAYDHLRFDWRGDPAAGNSLEVGLINRVLGQERIFARGYHHVTHHAWWGQLVVPFSFLHPWTSGTQFDPAHVSAFFISVVVDKVDDLGGAGQLAIDNLNAYNVISRSVPSSFATATGNATAATAAVNWLASQQHSTGLLKSWEEEANCTAHIYDQALALIAFAHEGMWAQADALVEGLIAAQNGDGSWAKSYQCDDADLPCVDCHHWEGDAAWAVYGLSRYIRLGGTQTQARAAMEAGARWLMTRLGADGCFVEDHTEGSIDIWWALQAAGPAFIDQAAALQGCLLTHYWDEAMGRFKGGKDWQQPYLDNQTWGGAFLEAIGQEKSALRALSYAWDVLRLPDQGGALFGLDGQAGSWSVWNEGGGQYVAVGGDGADDLLVELLAQQQEDGAMPGSPDDFAGGGVWTTRWHGVAPTAWLYNALNAEPFYPTRYHRLYIPALLKNYTP
jgi:hypothetical protein